MKKQTELAEIAAATAEHNLSGIKDKEAKRKAEKDRLEALQKAKNIWKMLDSLEKHAVKTSDKEKENEARLGKAALLRRTGFIEIDMADSPWHDESDGAHDSESRSKEQKLANSVVAAEISSTGDVSDEVLHMWKKAFSLEKRPDVEIKPWLLNRLF